MPYPLVQALLVIVVGAAMFTSMGHIHMALHRTGPSSLLVKVSLAGCAALIGLSATRWIAQHNRLHHPYLNRDGFDPDLDFEPVFRLHVSQPCRWWHRYQAFYCWLLYPLTLFGMTLGSFRIVLSGSTRDGRTFVGSQRRRVLLEILFGPAVVLAACIGWLGVANGLVDWVGAYLVAGTLLGLTFQVNHCSVLPGERPERRWQPGLGTYERVLLGTLDVCPSSSALAFFTGSLSRHSAHHMHPTRNQAWIGQKTLTLGTNPAYRHVTSVGAGLRAHYRYMRMLGVGTVEHQGTPAPAPAPAPVLV
jgi:linoleoyl-CoA desaturase